MDPATKILYDAMVKIASENDEWGPYPEANNPNWGPMAIVEARQSLRDFRKAIEPVKVEHWTDGLPAGDVLGVFGPESGA